MSEYIITLVDEYQIFKNELSKIGNVTYKSSIMRGVVGLETNYTRLELLECHFIQSVELNYVGYTY